MLEKEKNLNKNKLIFLVGGGGGGGGKPPRTGFFRGVGRHIAQTENKKNLETKKLDRQKWFCWIEAASQGALSKGLVSL